MDGSLHAVGWLVRTGCFLTAITVVPVVHSTQHHVAAILQFGSA